MQGSFANAEESAANTSTGVSLPLRRTKLTALSLPTKLARPQEAISARCTFVPAVSGGHTSWVMLRDLAAMGIPWPAVHIVQVDERVAPDGHTDPNLTHLRESLRVAPIAREQIYAMSVESHDLEGAAAGYSATLAGIAGKSPVFDVVQAELGADGHTASLVPRNPVLNVEDADVAGRRRVTLACPAINRARNILWVVTGAEKAEMCQQLVAGDRFIPAGRIRRDRALILADRAAAATAGIAIPPKVVVPITRPADPIHRSHPNMDMRPRRA